MTDLRTENSRTLASLLGLTQNEAAPLLEIEVAVTADPADVGAMVMAAHLQNLLSRTVANVPINGALKSAAAEIVVGAAIPTRTDAVRVCVSSEMVQIGTAIPAHVLPQDTHPILLLVASCYAAGSVLKRAFGTRLKVPGPPPSNSFAFPISAIAGSNPSWLSTAFRLEDSYMAGAGAIGNGFIYAMSLLPVSGSLVIADSDAVSDGNLNRCLWFTSTDVGFLKARRLAENAQPYLPQLKLVPKEMSLQEVGKASRSDDWLKRLVVAVDSRRARRGLQNELPREVFDASTTGALECVIHHHIQPMDKACLACIYHEAPDELARERHIAATLGVGLEDVKQHYVSADAANRIRERYPDVPKERIEGQAYDSLFKALCGEGHLLSAENRQMLAPFAFVSVLAGTYLAIELSRRLVRDRVAQDFNYWRVSPWAPPNPDLKQVRGRHQDCEFCSQPAVLRTAHTLWGH
jgi:molybdopterin/thiamine biosynthesis adenylyltransferase